MLNQTLHVMLFVNIFRVHTSKRLHEQISHKETYSLVETSASSKPKRTRYIFLTFCSLLHCDRSGFQMLFCEWRIDEQQLKLVENIRMLYDIISLILLSGLDPWPLDPLDPPKYNIDFTQTFSWFHDRFTSLQLRIIIFYSRSIGPLKGLRYPTRPTELVQPCKGIRIIGSWLIQQMDIYILVFGYVQGPQLVALLKHWKTTVSHYQQLTCESPIEDMIGNEFIY